MYMTLLMTAALGAPAWAVWTLTAMRMATWSTWTCALLEIFQMPRFICQFGR